MGINPLGKWKKADFKKAEIEIQQYKAKSQLELKRIASFVMRTRSVFLCWI
jgi:hypothetical protein